MASKKKKTNNIAVAPAQPQNGFAIVNTPGNAYCDYTGAVASLDEKKGGPVIDDKGLVQVQIKERYEFNKEHRRPYRKRNKSLWTIPEAEEFKVFRISRKYGAFSFWQVDRCKGYGLYIPNLPIDKTPQVLGMGFNNEEVKVCQFREGNKGVWHGFPFNYMLPDEDYICDNALFAWVRLGIIDKSDLDDIRNKEESIIA